MNRCLAFLLVCAFLCSCIWNDTTCAPDYLSIDDSEYPYADLPRLVIETENHVQIRDRDTEIPAKLLVYGKDSPESEIMELTIRGRGYSSFQTPKCSYKIKFSQSNNFLGLPKGKSWDLISNYIDKSLIRNKISFALANLLNTRYTPRSTFVELYLNRQYMGVFLLTEHITVSKRRVDIPQEESSFLFEMEPPENGDDIYITTKIGSSFKIHYPKDHDNPYIDTLISFIDKWENYHYYSPQKNQTDKWFDFGEYIKYYWVQEFSKNNDAAYTRSIYFTWQKDDVIRMGPVWDFDVAYGNKPQKKMQTSEDWHIRENGWNKPFFSDSTLKKRVSTFWTQHHEAFENILDTVDVYSAQIKNAAQNEYKRWNIQDATIYGNSSQIYNSHQESIDSLKSWISQRIQWIDNNYDR